jgi:CDGSH-type Zn-finger protein
MTIGLPRSRVDEMLDLAAGPDKEAATEYRQKVGAGVQKALAGQFPKYDLTGKPAFSLCRCGGSVNKPFCDGTHSKIGFQAAEAAVRAEKKE